MAARGGSRDDAVSHIDAARAGSDQLCAGAGAWLHDAERILARESV